MRATSASQFATNFAAPIFVLVLFECPHPAISKGETKADLVSVGAEIDRARKLVDRQRWDIFALQRAGISAADAELDACAVACRP
jgi:hypothetical protein